MTLHPIDLVANGDTVIAIDMKIDTDTVTWRDLFYNMTESYTCSPYHSDFFHIIVLF